MVATSALAGVTDPVLLYLSFQMVFFHCKCHVTCTIIYFFFFRNGSTKLDIRMYSVETVSLFPGGSIVHYIDPKSCVGQ